MDRRVAGLTISVVSHGHKDLVAAFAKQLASVSTHIYIRLIITINSLTLEDFDQATIDRNDHIEVLLLKNPTLLGFGANHNRAFQHCRSQFFCVVNPDIEILNDSFMNLVDEFVDSRIGLAYPSQVNGKGSLLDFERDLASPASIAKRHLLKKHRRFIDYKPHPVQWVSGAFMMFKSSVFRELCGFDERYFMYCEDVDICLRLQLAGYQLAKADATVIHHTQRRTLKNLQHLAWHVRSLLRLWNSAAYKQYKGRFIDNKT